MNRYLLTLAVALAAVTIVPGCKTAQAVTAVDHIERVLMFSGPVADAAIIAYGPEAGLTAEEVDLWREALKHAHITGQKLLAFAKLRAATGLPPGVGDAPRGGSRGPVAPDAETFDDAGDGAGDDAEGPPTEGSVRPDLRERTEEGPMVNLSWQRDYDSTASDATGVVTLVVIAGDSVTAASHDVERGHIAQQKHPADTPPTLASPRRQLPRAPRILAPPANTWDGEQRVAYQARRL